MILLSAKVERKIDCTAFAAAFFIDSLRIVTLNPE